MFNNKVYHRIDALSGSIATLRAEGVKYNEIAIIDNGSTPYVIAYLTNNVEMDDLQDVASTLGKYVHQRVDSIK